MEQRKIVSMIGMLVVLINALFMITGCPDKPLGEPQYTKENFVLKFKNESGKKCYGIVNSSAVPKYPKCI